MTRSGVLRVVFERAALVGLPGLHPHQLRHALAAWWLAAGGTEGDLMRLAGWKSRSMVDRSAKAAAEQRARAACARLGLGDGIRSAGQGSAPPRRRQHARRGYWPVR